MTPARALAVARQCAGEGRSTPAPVVAVLLAELARLGEVERAARRAIPNADALRAVVVAEGLDDLRETLRS